MEHFADVKKRYPASVPMQRIVAFAIFSTRRQEEITTIKWADYDQPHTRPRHEAPRREDRQSYVVRSPTGGICDR